MNATVRTATASTTGRVKTTVDLGRKPSPTMRGWNSLMSRVITEVAPAVLASACAISRAEAERLFAGEKPTLKQFGRIRKFMASRKA